MKSVLFPFNKSGLWEKISMVSHEDIFLPLTKHDRNSLKDPASYVLSYLPGLSVLSMHPLSLPSPHKVGGIYFVELWAHSFFSEQEAPASCLCLAAASDGWHVLPRDWVPNPYPSLLRLFFPRKASASFFDHNSCHLIQTRAAPEAMVSRW